MPLDPATQDLVDQILDLYREAQASLIDELVAAATDTTATGAAYRARVASLARAVTEAMTDLDRSARGWVRSELSTAYQLGATQAAGDIGAEFNWSVIHLDAVRALAGDTLQDLLSATRYVRRDMKRFIREAARARIRAVLLEGKTATQAGRLLAREIGEQGIAAVTYKNGARHGLADYADTVIRTRAAEVQNTGTLNVGRQNGIRWVQVSDGPTCGWDRHDSGDTANGSVRTLADAEAHPLSHPRCARGFALLPVRTKAEAERIARGDLSDVQIIQPPKPRAPAHQKRLEQRQARIDARAAKVRARA